MYFVTYVQSPSETRHNQKERALEPGTEKEPGSGSFYSKNNGDDLEMFHTWNKDVVKSSGSVWRTLIIAYSLPVSK